METTLDSRTAVGIGFANLVDAFQAGREAAQMAKRELRHHATIDLVVALGPDSVHFQDFVEGVRLVTGEEKLLGIPTTGIFFPSLTTPSSHLVIMLSSQQNQYQISCSPLTTNIMATVTALITNFRKARGNNRHQFEHHGILFFDNTSELGITPTQAIAADSGLDSWVVGLRSRSMESRLLMCRDDTLNNGLVGLECLTNKPVGLGVVNLHAFRNQPKAIHEALRISLRDAVLKMEEAQPAMSLVLMDIDPELITNQDFKNLFQTNSIASKPFPCIGICTQRHYVRPEHYAPVETTESIVSVVFPQ